MKAQFQIKIKEKYNFQKSLITDQLLCLYHNCIIGEMEDTFIVAGTMEQMSTLWKLKGNYSERATEISKKPGT